MHCAQSGACFQQASGFAFMKAQTVRISLQSALTSALVSVTQGGLEPARADSELSLSVAKAGE